MCLKTSQSATTIEALEALYSSETKALFNVIVNKPGVNPPGGLETVGLRVSYPLAEAVLTTTNAYNMAQVKVFWEFDKNFSQTLFDGGHFDTIVFDIVKKGSASCGPLGQTAPIMVMLPVEHAEDLRRLTHASLHMFPSANVVFLPVLLFLVKMARETLAQPSRFDEILVSLGMPSEWAAQIQENTTMGAAVTEEFKAVYGEELIRELALYAEEALSAKRGDQEGA